MIHEILFPQKKNGSIPLRPFISNTFKISFSALHLYALSHFLKSPEEFDASRGKNGED